MQTIFSCYQWYVSACTSNLTVNNKVVHKNTMYPEKIIQDFNIELKCVSPVFTCCKYEEKICLYANIPKKANTEKGESLNLKNCEGVVVIMIAH